MARTGSTTMAARAAALALTLLFVAGFQDPPGEGELVVEHYQDGVKSAAGRVVDGRRAGEWETFHENGVLASKGTYKAGVRVGPWELYHPTGRLAGRGFFKLGLHNGPWSYWDERGRKDFKESGTYSAELEHWPNGARKHAGEFRDKKEHGVWTWWDAEGNKRREGVYARGFRDGEWTYYWPGSGAIQYAGAFKREKREGAWVFHHQDGTPDPEMITFVFRRGKRKSGLSAADAAAMRAAWDIHLEELPAPRPAPGFGPAEETALRALVEHFLASSTLRDDDAAELTRSGNLFVPALITKFVELELETADGVQQGYAIHRILQRIHDGHAFGWTNATDADAVTRNRLAILRWHSLWSLTGDSEVFWRSLPTVAPEALVSPTLLDLPFDESGLDPAPMRPAAGARPPRTKNERKRLIRDHGGEGTERALAAALDWLVLHQRVDGRWSCAGFADECEAHGGEACGGPGEAVHEVGVTGLALLALLGDGSTPFGGDHAGAVKRGLAWLRSVQHPESGVFGGGRGHAYMYGHAIATEVMAEAAAAGDSAARDPLASGVAAILAARNPELAWRYGERPTGENDTSITAWMVSALKAAERAGVPIPEAAYAGALAWLDSITEPETGRVGYESRGSFSSRVSSVNAEFPSDRGEPLTAAGLLTRIVLGLEPARVPVMKLGAELLAKQPPTYEHGYTDSYYWYYGSYATFQLGGDEWGAWNSALKRAALESQNRSNLSGDYGSWNPDGPWGRYGGRIYATAMMALTLEVYSRRPRVL